MENNLISIGILVILAGFALVFIGSLTGTQKDTKIAIGGFIGPFPFGFANDKTMLYFVMGLSLFIFISFIYNTLSSL